MDPHPRPDFAHLTSPHHRWIDTVEGPMLGFVGDTGVSETLARFGQFSMTEIVEYRKLLKPGDMVLDIGANLGVISAFLQRPGQQFQIWAFEPQPSIHTVAAINLFGLAKTRVLPLAVGDTDRLIGVPEIDIRSRGNFGKVPANMTADRLYPVQQVRLDTLFTNPDRKPALIKIDVEGMETQVLRGAEGLFHDGLILSVEADREDVVRQWLPDLLARGLSCHLMLFPHLDKDDPRYDPKDQRCRILAAQIIALGSNAAREHRDRLGSYRITGFDEYRERMTSER